MKNAVKKIIIAISVCCFVFTAGFLTGTIRSKSKSEREYNATFQQYQSELESARQSNTELGKQLAESRESISDIRQSIESSRSNAKDAHGTVESIRIEIAELERLVSGIYKKTETAE